MYPPIFEVCLASAPVVALLGSDPMKLYPAGEAPQGVTEPYAVWQSVSGSPENFINQAPDLDAWTLQVDVYSSDLTEVRNVAQALRDAVEPHATILAWRGESREADTQLYRYSFDLDWLVRR